VAAAGGELEVKVDNNSESNFCVGGVRCRNTNGNNNNNSNSNCFCSTFRFE
jgi:hypothetical protein